MQPIQYSKYGLSHLIRVREIVSADYFTGPHPARFSHLHQDAWELCCCVLGTLTVQKGEDLISLKEGQIILIAPGTLHDIAVPDSGAKAFVTSFTISGGEFMHLIRDRIFQAAPAQMLLFEMMITELENAFVQDYEWLHLFSFRPSGNSPIGAEQMICCSLEQILILLFRGAAAPEGQVVKTKHYRTAMYAYLTDQVNAYIEEHISGPLTVEMIASHFHYSRARLSTIYKETAGISLSHAIGSARISRAKEMLLTRKYSVGEISDALGYSSPQYFSYCFSQSTGLSPTRFAEPDQNK